MIETYVTLARTHEALLIVCTPLAGAGLAVAMPQARLSWLVAVIAALATAMIAADMGARHLLFGAPFVPVREGVSLALDGAGAFVAPLIAAALALVVIGGGGALRDFGSRTGPYAMALSLCAGAGWLGALLAKDWVGVFLGAEIGWLSALSLGALGGERDRGALNGALRMLSAGGVAAALMLLGVGLVSRAVGSADLAALANVVVAAPGLASTGIVLILVSLALKAGVAPLHAWAGPAYARAGGFAAMVIGVVGAVGALGVLTRVAAFAAAAPATGAGVSAALMVLGIVSVVVGSVQAVGAGNLRRLAAYAFASQAGCLLLSLSLGSPAGFAAALIQLFALTAGALALLAGACASEDSALSAIDGLGRRAPLASAAMTAGALTLMGAPLTTGFLGRWRLIEAGVGAGWWWAAGAAILASLAGVFYGGRLIERLYFRRATTTVAVRRNVWHLALTPALTVAILAIAVGVAPEALLQAATSAAGLLLGRAP